MCVFLLLTFYFQKEMHLDGLTTPVNIIRVWSEGGFLVVQERSLFSYTADGSLIQKITSDSRILDFAFDGKHYYVTSNSGHMALYDRQGNIVANTENHDLVIRYFFQSNLANKIFGSTAKVEFDIDYNPFYIAINSFEVTTDNGNLAVTTKPLFGKLAKKIQVLNYNFKNMWVYFNEPISYLVNECEPRVYLYDKSSIKAEKASGTKIASHTPYTALILPKYVPSPDMVFSLTKPVHKDKLSEMYTNWWKSWSRITWFGQHKNGFVISYEIPDCNPEKPGECPSTHLGVQRLDAKFQPVGDLIELEGKMIGVNPGGEICVFVPNPIIEDGKEVGYAPKVIFFD